MSAEAQVLLIAGLDPSGGAGLLADARVVAERGLRAVGVVTALTEQTTAGVRAANPVPAEILARQLRALLSDVEVAAVKIGMLGSEAIAAAVADALALSAAPVVWDPVLRPTRGRVALFEGSAARAVQLLAPHVTLLTPNLGEAAALAGGAPIRDVAGMRKAAAALRALGFGAVLVTGGHLGEAAAAPPARVTDLLVGSEGARELSSPWVDTGGPVHGTGCALSTAVACGLAAGAALEEAVVAARAEVGRRLRAVRRPGRGMGAVV